MKEKLKDIGALAFGIGIALLIFEVILNFYHPFEFRQKGDKIVLPANAKYVYQNNKIHGVDSLIVHTKNDLGFRGPDLPTNPKDWTKIIAVGGSTTECAYLSDGKDWPFLLAQKLQQTHEKTWINNAGLDGHSTFGHLILMEDYISKFQPDYVLFLVGCNDVGREDLNTFDNKNLQKKHQYWKQYLIDKSEVLSLGVNIKRYFLARAKGVEHQSINLKQIDQVDDIDTIKYQQKIQSHQIFQKSYEERLKKLIQLAKKYNSKPIFITQPSLLGFGIDPVTKVDLAKIKLGNSLGGKAYWEILESYNNTTRKVALENGLLLVDLAKEMPKSSHYFYDTIHFTDAGAAVVAEIVAKELVKYLQ